MLGFFLIISLILVWVYLIAYNFFNSSFILQNFIIISWCRTKWKKHEPCIEGICCMQYASIASSYFLMINNNYNNNHRNNSLKKNKIFIQCILCFHLFFILFIFSPTFSNVILFHLHVICEKFHFTSTYFLCVYSGSYLLLCWCYTANCYPCICYKVTIFSYTFQYTMNTYVCILYLYLYYKQKPICVLYYCYHWIKWNRSHHHNKNEGKNMHILIGIWKMSKRKKKFKADFILLQWIENVKNYSIPDGSFIEISLERRSKKAIRKC